MKLKTTEMIIYVAVISRMPRNTLVRKKHVKKLKISVFHGWN